MSKVDMYEYSTKNDRVPPAMRKAILERDGYRCVICKFHSPDRLGLLHIDHKHPKSKGGPTVPENLRTLCGDCNMKKRNNVAACPNCGVWVVEDKPFCPSCSFALAPLVQNIASRPKSSSKALIRRVLLAVAAVLLLYSGGMLAYQFVSGVLTSRQKASTTTGGESCAIVDPNGRANLKTKCDSMDCDNDPATVAGKINAGATVTKTGKAVGSSLPAVGEWIEVLFNGQTVFVASTKLACK